MASKVKLDKDTILEFLDLRKDVLFISLLLATILVGGWFLYQQSSLSVESLIDEATKKPPVGGASAGTTSNVVPKEVVESLLEKRVRQLYTTQRNPFGSPEEQLRLRDEVQRTYNRAVDLFNAGEFQAAIEQFDQVITFDVTETRIPYPIQPSEYKRRAQREYLKTNFQSMFTSAANDIQEGDRFSSGSQLQEAEKVYSRANKTLSDALAADPDGAAIGKENLDKIQKMQQSVFQKWQTIQSSMLKSDVQKGIAQAQQFLGQPDLVALMKSWVQLGQVQERLNLVDPNFTMVTQDQRLPIQNLITQIQERLQTNYQDLVSQAEDQFNQALAAKDMVATKEALQVMRLGMNINAQDTNLPKKIAALVVERAKLVIELADSFIAQQKQLISKQQFDQFDADGKVRFLDELIAIRTLPSGSISTELRSQIIDRENTLRKDIRKPPLLTEAYDFVDIKKSTVGDAWKIVINDKKSRTGSKSRSLNLTVGRRDASTQITLTEVDSAGGFVILSKPGYSETKVTINQTN